MPLISITTKAAWAPANGPAVGAFDHYNEPTEPPPWWRKTWMKQFSLELPNEVAAQAEALRLHHDTTPDAVQVTFHSFGPHDVNVPDIWFFILCTEDMEPHEVKFSENNFSVMLRKLGEPVGWWQEGGPDIALDVFCGPGCGRIIRGSSLVVSW